MKLYLCIATFGLIYCCSAKVQPGKRQHKVTTRTAKLKFISKAQALQIAKSVVARKENWGNLAEYHPKIIDAYWYVSVERLTYDQNGKRIYIIGANRVIVLSNSGKVLHYLYGH